jgi:hypothetical protein
MECLLIQPKIVEGKRRKFKFVKANLLRIGKLDELVVDDVLVDICKRKSYS